ncbi:esterase/lipase family protein [Gordonia sp. NPDC003424]
MKLLHRIAMTVGAAFALATSAVAPAVAHAAPTDRGTVIIVPGQLLGGTLYTPMAESLRREGYRVRLTDLRGTDLRGDARALAAMVAEAKTAHPASPISLVGHSIGGLTIRYYAKMLGGAPNVSNVIAIGTPQYGSPGGCGQSGTDEMSCPGSPYLRALNRGDDTPGAARYYGIRSTYEWVTGDLDGGQCRFTPLPAFIAPDGGVEHTAEAFNPAVIQSVSRALRGHCDGRFVDDADGVRTARNSLRGR